MPAATTQKHQTTAHSKHTIHYFTDPICSSCWAIEPQMRKLKLTYDADFEVVYHMGGLLPDWSYKSGDIRQPSDVAQHWDEVSAYYDMPIDGDLWLENPLHSSFPPSIAFKAVQIQDQSKAIAFLRAIRERVFLHKQNITESALLVQVAEEVGVNPKQFLIDLETTAVALFEKDLQLVQEFGVRSFPTLVFCDENGPQQKLIGAKSYEEMEQTFLQYVPTACSRTYSTDWHALFTAFPTLTALEFSILSGIQRSQTPVYLDQLVAENHLQKFCTKNGDLWFLATS